MDQLSAVEELTRMDKSKPILAAACYPWLAFCYRADERWPEVVRFLPERADQIEMPLEVAQ